MRLTNILKEIQEELSDRDAYKIKNWREFAQGKGGRNDRYFNLDLIVYEYGKFLKGMGAYDQYINREFIASVYERALVYLDEALANFQNEKAAIEKVEKEMGTIVLEVLPEFTTLVSREQVKNDLQNFFQSKSIKMGTYFTSGTSSSWAGGINKIYSEEMGILTNLSKPKKFNSFFTKWQKMNNTKGFFIFSQEGVCTQIDFQTHLPRILMRFWHWEKEQAEKLQEEIIQLIERVGAKKYY